jgi:hypothetical protein
LSLDLHRLFGATTRLIGLIEADEKRFFETAPLYRSFAFIAGSKYRADWLD